MGGLRERERKLGLMISDTFLLVYEVVAMAKVLSIEMYGLSCIICTKRGTGPWKMHISIRKGICHRSKAHSRSVLGWHYRGDTIA